MEEFLLRVPEDWKADLIDGTAIVASLELVWHTEVTAFIHLLSDGFAQHRERGSAFIFKVAFELGRFDALSPDAALVAAEHQDRIQETHVVGAPDIAVEVVSSESRQRDYVDKKQLYLEGGTREYWSIEPRQRRAEFHRLTDRRYELVPLARNRIFRSEALPGFWLDVEWLFQWPLPNKFRCLQQILAGEPAS